MTVAARPFDTDSLFDQILAGSIRPSGPTAAGSRLTSTESAFVAAISEWCHREDQAVAIETSGEVPGDVLDELRALGAFRVTIPEQYGGLGFSDDCLLAVLSVLTTAHASLCEVVAAHQVIGAVRPLVEFGSEEQRNTHLPELLESPSAFALNEPELGYGAGPLKTTAHWDPDGGVYWLTGVKTWITNATVASHVVVLAEVEASAHTPGGVTAFLVKTDDPGVTVGPRSVFAGLRGLPNGTLRFDEAKIPTERVIGGEGHGVDVALACLAQCRAALPVACLTTVTACLAQAARWSGEERQISRGLPSNPQTQSHIVSLLVDALVANAVTWFVIRPRCSSTDAEAAKVVLSEVAGRATDSLLQLIGGRGFETAASACARGSAPWDVERLWRDTRVTRIFDSSTEMIKDYLAQPLADAPVAPGPGHHGHSEPASELTRLAVQISQTLEERPDDPWTRALAIEATMDLFTLVCLRRYQQHLREDAHPTTTVWEVAAEQLHDRIEHALRKSQRRESLALHRSLAEELTASSSRDLASPFTATLTELGAQR